MAAKQIQHFCPTCYMQRLYSKPGVSHILHGIASLVLINFFIPWFLVWIAATVINWGKNYRSSVCGETK
ncbi:MAG: hypothetical protein PHF56_19240 [Desulfuromonadaceae bacterium]|nr:hypothetical protein [Desulfuromonadaceae bacterium]